ncbi:MAG: sarcosine oxidase subunit delta [Hyphomicrobiaceae bacterium]|nr:sarcosine oxidase subunit delta [Hyphomicrobiaceae bacterium]
MRIPCPHCGERSLEEFTYLGPANPARAVPEAGRSALPAAGLDEAVTSTYLRDNLPGWVTGIWYHALGCRSVLLVERHATTHEIAGARLARARGVAPVARTGIGDA